MGQEESSTPPGDQPIRSFESWREAECRELGDVEDDNRSSVAAGIDAVVYMLRSQLENNIMKYFKYIDTHNRKLCYWVSAEGILAADQVLLDHCGINVVKDARFSCQVFNDEASARAAGYRCWYETPIHITIGRTVCNWKGVERVKFV